MNILYHGSGYKHTELKPGIEHSGKKKEWDKGESNEYLYATSVRDEAISQAFASVLEEHYTLNRYQTTGDTIKATFGGDKKPTQAQVAGHKVYLYTLVNKEEDKWEKNTNKHNGLETEWKTKSTIKKGILKVDEVDLEKWLKGKKLSISMESLTSLRW